MKKLNELQSYLTRLRGLMLTLIILCSIGVGNVWGQASTHTSNVTLTTGTNGSACTVSISGNNYAGIKMGTSRKTGSMSFSVPAGVTTVYIHAAKWKGETGNLKIARSNGTVSPTSVTLTADDGVTGSSPFTLSDPSKATTDYFFTLTLSSVNSATTVTLTTSSKRAVVWGVNTASATKTFTLAVPKGDGTYDKTQTGKKKTDLTETNAISAVSCGNGLNGTYANMWTSTAIGTPTYTYPSNVVTSSTADGDLPASGTTLYAVFTTNDEGKYTTNPLCADPKYYTVTYNYGSGTGSPASWTQTSGNLSTTLPTATPSCDGWNFAGWCTSSAGDEDNNTTSPGTILTGSYTPTSDVTLYAIYTKSSGGGGGSGSGTFTFSDIASSEGWKNSIAYTTVTIGDITIEAEGGGNNGKWYTSGGGSWRMYSGGTVKITCSEGDITEVTSSPTCSVPGP